MIQRIKYNETIKYIADKLVGAYLPIVIGIIAIVAVDYISDQEHDIAEDIGNYIAGVVQKD